MTSSGAPLRGLCPGGFEQPLGIAGAFHRCAVAVRNPPGERSRRLGRRAARSLAEPAIAWQRQAHASPNLPRARHRRLPDPRSPGAAGPRTPPLLRRARGVADVVPASAGVGERQRPRFRCPASPSRTSPARLSDERRRQTPAKAPPTSLRLTGHGVDRDARSRDARATVRAKALCPERSLNVRD
jgi:hypothetical protein